MRRNVLITVVGLGALALVLAVTVALTGTKLDQARLERDDLEVEVESLRASTESLRVERDGLQAEQDAVESSGTR